MPNNPLNTELLDRAIVFADALRELQDTSAYKEFEQLINQVF